MFVDTIQMHNILTTTGVAKETPQPDLSQWTSLSPVKPHAFPTSKTYLQQRRETAFQNKASEVCKPTIPSVE